MTIMQTKGLLNRDEANRTHIYSTSITQVEMEKKLVQQLITEVFGGSATRLVSRALTAEVTSVADAEKIERLLEALDDPEPA
jgi:BlaI family penicillinase repressor